jgi:hypothetical protein
MFTFFNTNVLRLAKWPSAQVFGLKISAYDLTLSHWVTFALSCGISHSRLRALCYYLTNKRSGMCVQKLSSAPNDPTERNWDSEISGAPHFDAKIMRRRLHVVQNNARFAHKTHLSWNHLKFQQRTQSAQQCTKAARDLWAAVILTY